MRFRIAVAVALGLGLNFSPAGATNWSKWDDVTWIDMDSIHTDSGLTTYSYLMLDHIVSYPAETAGNYLGRVNCATAEGWVWETTDPLDPDNTPAHWEKENFSISAGLLHKLCGR